MSTDLLSPEDYATILQRRFNNARIKFVSAEVKSFTENLDGWLGQHLIAVVKYRVDQPEGDNNDDLKIENFFVKSKPTATNQLDMAESLNAYGKELFLYGKLFKEFEDRGYCVSFAPRAFLCKEGSTLVLEDLKTRGFTLAGKTSLFDFAKMRGAMKALALYHAASISYEEHKSQELQRPYRLDQEFPEEFKENFLRFDDAQSLGSTCFATSIECFVKIVELLDESSEWKQEFQERMKGVDFHQQFQQELKCRKACGHGDLWSNNMMFRELEDGAEMECCLLDFQVLRYHYPAFDMLLLLYTNTDSKLRRAHQQDLVNYYYECVSKALRDNHLDASTVFPLADLQEDAARLEYLAAFEAAFAHTLTFMNVDYVRTAMANDNMERLLDDRPTTVFEAFKLDPLLRTVLTDDLYNVHALLIK